MLARRMGKKRIIAETGAGQHGVATATVAARFGLECIVYMGERDIERQQPNVFRMKLLGRRGPAGELGLAHAQGRAERGPARLGQQPARHLLRHRHGGRPAPLPGDGARLPVDHRHRGQGAAAWRRRAGCRTCWWRPSAAAPTPWACSIPFLDDREVRIVAVEAAGHGIATRRARGGDDRRPARASCTASAPTCCRTRTAR